MNPSHPPRWQSWGALLRLSLLPSALADVCCGLWLAGTWPFQSAALPAFGASLLIYHGGLALNDWRDRELDRPLRPGRPLVSGALPPGAALAAGALGLFVGPALGLFGGSLAALIWAAVAVCAAIYDLWSGARASSPLWLGSCRAGNLLAAAAFGAELRGSSGLTGLGSLAPWAALLYGLYVAAVSFLARLEDDPQQAPGSRPRARLLGIAALLAGLAPAALALSGRLAWPPRLEQGLALALCLAAASGLLRAALARERWSHGEVARDVGAGLRRLLVATAALSLCAGAPGSGIVALAILAGYPLAHGLRRVFPPS
jgi:4-hydroxybenzoate polyprenyltransferase